MTVVDDGAAEASARWVLAGSFTMPADDEMLSDSALAALVGWSGGARTIANRRHRRYSLPASVLIGRQHFYSGAAVRQWILSGAAAESGTLDEFLDCPTCGQRCRGSRGLATHQAHRGHRPATPASR